MVVVACRTNGYDFIVFGWISDIASTVVSGSSNDRHALIICILYSLLQCDSTLGGSQAHINDFGAIVYSVVYTIRYIGQTS